MKKKNLYLAADSGGSKTVWVLLDANGDEITRYYSKGLGSIKEGESWVSLSVKEASEHLAPYGCPEKIFLSLGGPNVEEIRSLLVQFFGIEKVCVEREARGDMILAAAKQLGCDAAVMCGTGSVAVGDCSQGRRYAGGWGPIYGDGGSGGGLGSDALKLFLQSFDGEPFTEGMEKLFSALSHGLDVARFDDRMELKARALNLGRREIAAFAPGIYRLAEEGDPVATGLYEKAAKEIAELALRVSEDRSDSCVLLCGGFFREKPLLLDLCKKLFAEQSRAQLRYEPLFSPILGAKLCVLQGVGTMNEVEKFQKILNDERKYCNE